MANVKRQLGIVARWQSRYERADALLRESVTQARKITPNRGFSLARSLSNLARVAYFQGDYQRARKLLYETLGVIGESRLAGWPLADCLDWLAALEGAEADPVRAACLIGAAEAQWRASGAVRYSADQPAYECDVAGVRAQLDQHAFASALADGQLMNAQQVIAYALKKAAPVRVEPHAHEHNERAVHSA